MFKTAFQKKVHNRFFVTPKVGLNFSGVLVKAGRAEKDWSTFVDVKAHLPNSSPEPLEGDMLIQNSNIAYAQIIPVSYTHTVITHSIEDDDADD